MSLFNFIKKELPQPEINSENPVNWGWEKHRCGSWEKDTFRLSYLKGCNHQPQRWYFYNSADKGNTQKDYFYEYLLADDLNFMAAKMERIKSQ